MPVNSSYGGNTTDSPISYYPNAVALGADPTGRKDSTSALQRCLDGAAGTICHISAPTRRPPVRLAILASLTIPANTTLDCGVGVPDSEDRIVDYANLSALILVSGATIGAGGEGAAVEHCLIYRSGMRFPAPGPDAYEGLAFTDNNHGNFTLVNDVILGFDSAFYGTGTRPYIRHVFTDCAGATRACIEIDNGNTDSGYIDDLKIQPLATGNYGGGVGCAAALRPGVGLKINGINFLGNDVVVQNFKTADVEIGGLVVANELWSDFVVQCRSSRDGPGIKIGKGGALLASSVNVNGSESGIHFVTDSREATSRIGSLFVNMIGQDCVQVGAGGTAAGRIVIDAMFTNNGGQANCGRYAVNWLDTTSGSSLTINGGALYGVNHNAAPYINIPAKVPASAVRISEHIDTDLINPAALYGAAVIGTCTGLGATGSCSLVSSSLTTPWQGAIRLDVTAGPATTGTVPLTWPLTLVNQHGCIAGLTNGSAHWPLASVELASIDATHTALTWTASTALAAGQSYTINFHCQPQ
jgi:hypothetical protein